MATRRMIGGAQMSPGIPGNMGMPGGRMPALPPRPGMMGAGGGAANNPQPGMPGPQAGAMGGAMGGPVPLPGQPAPSQPTAGGPLSPMNVQGSGMLTAPGAQPSGLRPSPAPTPLPPWGSQPSTTGMPGTSAGQQGGQLPQGPDQDVQDLMGPNAKPANANASESMSPMVMLRMLKAMGRI